MHLKKIPEPRSKFLGGRRKFLWNVSRILWFLYFITGCGVAAYFIGFPTRYYIWEPPNQTILFFYYRNGTPLFPDPVTLWTFGFLSLVTLSLLIVSAFAAVSLTGSYLHWRKGSSAQTVADDHTEYKYIPGLTPVQTCRVILITAWLACITITGVIIIGIPFSEGIWVFCIIWILAIFQTVFVRKMQQEYDNGE